LRAFTSRLPCFDVELIGVVKRLVQYFWNENNRPSPNQNDLLNLRRGSRDHESHIKHFLDMTWA
jgi:hypothetical protein